MLNKLPLLFPWKHNKTKIMAEHTLEEVSAPADEDLLPCTICGRTFLPAPLTKHTRICERNANRKRKIFNSLKQRVEGTDLALFHQRTYLKKTEPPPAQASDPVRQNKWKEKHLELVNAIRAAKGVPTPAMPTLTAKHSTSQSSNHERCPSCDRQFGPKAFDRHVEWCKEKKNRIHKSPANVQMAKERLEARTKYKVPPLNKSKRAITREKYSPQTNRSESVASMKSVSACTLDRSPSVRKSKTVLTTRKSVDRIEHPKGELVSEKTHREKVEAHVGDVKKAAADDRNVPKEAKKNPAPEPMKSSNPKGLIPVCKINTTSVNADVLGLVVAPLVVHCNNGNEPKKLVTWKDTIRSARSDDCCGPAANAANIKTIKARTDKPSGCKVRPAAKTTVTRTATNRKYSKTDLSNSESEENCNLNVGIKVNVVRKVRPIASTAQKITVPRKNESSPEINVLDDDDVVSNNAEPVADDTLKEELHIFYKPAREKKIEKVRHNSNHKENEDIAQSTKERAKEEEPVCKSKYMKDDTQKEEVHIFHKPPREKKVETVHQNCSNSTEDEDIAQPTKEHVKEEKLIYKSKYMEDIYEGSLEDAHTIDAPPEISKYLEDESTSVDSNTVDLPPLSKPSVELETLGENATCIVKLEEKSSASDADANSVLSEDKATSEMFREESLGSLLNGDVYEDDYYNRQLLGLKQKLDCFKTLSQPKQVYTFNLKHNDDETEETRFGRRDGAGTGDDGVDASEGDKFSAKFNVDSFDAHGTQDVSETKATDGSSVKHCNEPSSELRIEIGGGASEIDATGRSSVKHCDGPGSELRIEIGDANENEKVSGHTDKNDKLGGKFCADNLDAGSVQDVERIDSRSNDTRPVEAADGKETNCMSNFTAEVTEPESAPVENCDTHNDRQDAVSTSSNKTAQSKFTASRSSLRTSNVFKPVKSTYSGISYLNKYKLDKKKFCCENFLEKNKLCDEFNGASDLETQNASACETLDSTISHSPQVKEDAQNLEGNVRSEVVTCSGKDDDGFQHNGSQVSLQINQADTEAKESDKIVLLEECEINSNRNSVDELSAADDTNIHSESQINVDEDYFDSLDEVDGADSDGKGTSIGSQDALNDDNLDIKEILPCVSPVSSSGSMLFIREQNAENFSDLESVVGGCENEHSQALSIARLQRDTRKCCSDICLPKLSQCSLASYTEIDLKKFSSYECTNIQSDSSCEGGLLPDKVLEVAGEEFIASLKARSSGASFGRDENELATSTPISNKKVASPIANVGIPSKRRKLDMDEEGVAETPSVCMNNLKMNIEQIKQKKLQKGDEKEETAYSDTFNEDDSAAIIREKLYELSINLSISSNDEYDAEEIYAYKDNESINSEDTDEYDMEGKYIGKDDKITNSEDSIEMKTVLSTIEEGSSNASLSLINKQNLTESNSNQQNCVQQLHDYNLITLEQASIKSLIPEKCSSSNLSNKENSETNVNYNKRCTLERQPQERPSSTSTVSSISPRFLQIIKNVIHPEEKVKSRQIYGEHEQNDLVEISRRHCRRLMNLDRKKLSTILDSEPLKLPKIRTRQEAKERSRLPEKVSLPKINDKFKSTGGEVMLPWVCQAGSKSKIPVAMHSESKSQLLKIEGVTCTLSPRPSSNDEYNPFISAERQLRELLECDDFKTLTNTSTPTKPTRPHTTANTKSKSPVPIKLKKVIKSADKSQKAVRHKSISPVPKRASVIDPPSDFQDRISKLNDEFEFLENLINDNYDTNSSKLKKGANGNVCYTEVANDRLSLNAVLCERKFSDDMSVIDPRLINENDNLSIPESLQIENGSPNSVLNKHYTESINAYSEVDHYSQHYENTISSIEPRQTEIKLKHSISLLDDIDNLEDLQIDEFMITLSEADHFEQPTVNDTQSALTSKKPLKYSKVTKQNSGKSNVSLNSSFGYTGNTDKKKNLSSLKRSISLLDPVQKPKPLKNKQDVQNYFNEQELKSPVKAEKTNTRREMANAKIVEEPYSPKPDELFSVDDEMYEEYKKYEEMYLREKEERMKKEDRRVSDGHSGMLTASEDDDSQNLAIKVSADSAYGSLNRKTPKVRARATKLTPLESQRNLVGDSASSSGSESSPVTPAACQKVSKFCHECGSKYPLASAKFCVECGVRRLVL